MYVVGWGIPITIVVVSAGYGIPTNSYVMLAKRNDSDSQNSITCPNNTLMYPVLEQPLPGLSHGKLQFSVLSVCVVNIDIYISIACTVCRFMNEFSFCRRQL